MRRAIPPAAALAALLALVTAVPSEAARQAGPDVKDRATRILEALARIETEKGRPSSAPRKMTFREDEFNAYVAWRLEAENEPFVKSARFKLLAENRFEGHIVLELGGQASGPLPQRQDLLFSGRFETREGRIRIDLDKLFLGAQPISPAFIDVVIGLVSRLQGVEPTSLRDWYDLPPGVLGLETRPGTVVIIY